MSHSKTWTSQRTWMSRSSSAVASERCSSKYCMCFTSSGRSQVKSRSTPRCSSFTWMVTDMPPADGASLLNEPRPLLPSAPCVGPAAVQEGCTLPGPGALSVWTSSSTPAARSRGDSRGADTAGSPFALTSAVTTSDAPAKAPGREEDSLISAPRPPPGSSRDTRDARCGAWAAARLARESVRRESLLPQLRAAGPPDAAHAARMAMMGSPGGPAGADPCCNLRAAAVCGRSGWVSPRRRPDDAEPEGPARSREVP
mmetsp:Transcript_6455/g.18750  ORF Transcript_6455/g.18750 Transcript_6455/m.18750 type:complete len:256 (+) Transcript_6455:2096-2863(+)